jgi:hypothetical protein
MPLQTPYGVIVGAVHDYDLENPDNGKWPHYHVHVSAGGQIMDSAINLKSLVDVQIEYRSRTFDLYDARFSSITSLADGLHVLPQNSMSGALDYVRHDGLTGTTGWTLQNGDNLISTLNALLAGVQRIYIFGATYSQGIGVHDVHMNQGDPDGSPFQPLDGIWQDGGLLFQYGGLQPGLASLQIKFETQTLFTDDSGHPLHWRIPPRVYYYIPRWHWPPGDPLSDRERQILVTTGLFQLASWAATIPEVPPETRGVLVDALRRQIEGRLPEASAAHVARVAEYLVNLGEAARTLRG